MSRGHIRSRSKGSWTIVIDLVRDVNGKRRQKWVTVKGTKKEANERMTELLREIDTGVYLDPKKLKVGDYLESWLRDYAKINVSAKTYVRYEGICRGHLIPAIGKFELQKLQPFHVLEYYSEALRSGRLDGKGGLSAQTVKHHHRVLSEALKKAVKWQLIPRNVCDAVDPPKPRKKEMRALDEAESAKLLHQAEFTRLYVPVLVALTTGLRRGELLGLKWSDLESNSLSINRSLEQTTQTGVTEKIPKTKKSRRSIVLTELAIDALRKHRVEQSERKLKLGSIYVDKDLIFPDEIGSYWKPDAFTKAFQRLVLKANIGHIRLHDLRHTHASQLLKEGVNPKVVSERLGHSSITVTMDTYSHILPGIQEGAVSKLNQRLKNAILNNS